MENVGWSADVCAVLLAAALSSSQGNQVLQRLECLKNLKNRSYHLSETPHQGSESLETLESTGVLRKIKNRQEVSLYHRRLALHELISKKLSRKRSYKQGISSFKCRSCLVFQNLLRNRSYQSILCVKVCVRLTTLVTFVRFAELLLVKLYKSCLACYLGKQKTEMKLGKPRKCLRIRSYQSTLKAQTSTQHRRPIKLSMPFPKRLSGLSLANSPGGEGIST